jgi:SAM-dependent methyltransferase
MQSIDKKNIITKYAESFKQHGYSPKALGWEKGRQEIRFKILTSFFNDFSNKTVLDIGCGFGDLFQFIFKNFNVNFQYIGIDITPQFIQKAQEIYANDSALFIEADFLEARIDSADIVLASGIFNHKLPSGNNLEFVHSVMTKAWNITKEGLAFDFLSDKVDYRHEHTFHNSPEKTLALAYNFSNNVILRNDYFPFEFALGLHKDISFAPGYPVFNHYLKQVNKDLTPPK